MEGPCPLGSKVLLDTMVRGTTEGPVRHHGQRHYRRQWKRTELELLLQQKEHRAGQRNL